MGFPQHAVSKWIGHSITVSGRHDANDVPDELSDRASRWAEPEAVQRAVQHSAAQPRTVSETPGCAFARNAHTPSTSEGVQELATRCEGEGKWPQGASNLRKIPFEITLRE